MKKSIKDILSIDLKYLLENSSLKKSKINDFRESIFYDLDSKFFGVFDQMEIRVFDGKPAHLIFRSTDDNSNEIQNLIRAITLEHGPDQNGLTEYNWEQRAHYGWWFKNEQHEQTTDDSLNPNPDPVYYGIMINPRGSNGIELSIVNYMVLENESNKHLALKDAQYDAAYFEGLAKKSRKTANNYYYLLTLFFLVNQVIFYADDEVQSSDAVGIIATTCLTLTFIALTIRGIHWAKWALSIILLLLSGMLLFAGFQIPSLNLKLVGIYYFFFGLIIHVSKNLRHISIQQEKEEISTEENIEAPNGLTPEGKTHSFPSSFDRNMAMFIDIIFIFILITISVFLNDKLGTNSIRVLIFSIALVLSYEPILTAYSSTLGRKIMRIGVRRFDKPEERISLKQSYLRFFTQLLLGSFSFLIFDISPTERPKHDQVASSIVIKV